MLAGLVYLALAVNVLSALVDGVHHLSYLVLYTPMKRRSSLCMLVGAVPGALPPVIGWVAARGILDSRRLGAVRDHVSVASAAYPGDRPALLRRLRQGGDSVFAGDRAGRREHQSPDHQPFSSRCSPSVCCRRCSELAGAIYFVAAFILGVGFFVCGIRLVLESTLSERRQLLFASLIYLPVLLLIMALDRSAVMNRIMTEPNSPSRVQVTGVSEFCWRRR